ncbi:MAG: transcription-repair coupling factor [Chromatiales bacterium]|jgi:transcription-repair coupling factor (superfamily II helicase)|nr:transcription-repair coupling factor [Chromatiales bacterium]MDP6151564.1 transcription-repair coupling factor [Gammaproteobacteria bacterium]MDP7270046.1 transcription-repair coupling factor [Gammaproteobacteria bacterium]
MKPDNLLTPRLPVNTVPESQGKTRLGCAYGCSAALLLAEMLPDLKDPALVVVPGVNEAENLAAELSFFAGDDDSVKLFPDPETLPYDQFSPHQDLVSRRLAMLSRILSGKPGYIIAAVPTLSYRLPPASYLRTFSLALKCDQQYGPADLQHQLVNSGYARVSQVNQHGEFAVRGSLLDLYPMGSDLPVRVDFFDDEIETLRYFDPDTQVSGKQLEELTMLPAGDYPVSPEAITGFRSRFRERFEGNPQLSPIYAEVSEGRFPGGIENYQPLFFKETRTLWDYLPPGCKVITLGDVQAALADNWQQIEDRFEQCRHDTERPALRPEELFCSPVEHGTQMEARPRLLLQRRELPEQEGIAANLNSLPAPTLLIHTHSAEPVSELGTFLEGYEGRVLLAAESPGRREMLADLLRNNGIEVSSINRWDEFLASNAPLSIVVTPLQSGLRLPEPELCIIAEHELFGTRPAARRKKKVKDPEAILSDLSDLNEGSPVVHIDYGVGRYRGLSYLDIDGVSSDFLTLEYAGGDLLHIPVGSLQLISRYTGTTAETAPLHRLGTDQWERARRKAAEQIRDVAAELLDLYATREARTGRSFRADPAEYEQFCAVFPFELTEDQEGAIEATLEDLRSERSMDRLICGDVGFGKTEVALRAAFVTTMAGGQVALLAPTTLLAQQHYQTFTDRFADWPVNIKVLSRFRSAKESRQTIASLAAGKVDIVIGTHKLLQQDIAFDNLGLVIVDEEHRFGVRQKERLKNLRAEVDILTLTATPIPRTLNMALGELRELSLITTPPESRLSIKTFVAEWEDGLIREASQRELKRGGQVFFVHNRIEDIQNIARRLEKIMPNASIRVAHGRMRESDLEQIMFDFYHRRFHILVCTAIIESGIDLPSANTIIINRADRFGLAQLHQLRGRVGRSHHKAYAFLLAPPDNMITADARKRLDAIEAMEDLGAGFVLATHDLEIRGAGELLGEQQTGQIQQIGFSLYAQMLASAVDAIRRGETPDMDESRALGPEVNLHVPALLPEDYMPDVQMRLVHYKRIASARSEDELKDLQVELIDRFGLLPGATLNLFRQTRLRLRASLWGIIKIEAWPAGATIEFAAGTRVSPAQIVSLIGQESDRYSLDSRQRLQLRTGLEDHEARFAELEGLIDRLCSAGPDNDLVAMSV